MSSCRSAGLWSGASPCRSGGIGRRAWFRSMYPQGGGGSSPFFGTNNIEVLRLAKARSGFRLSAPARLHLAHAAKAAQVQVHVPARVWGFESLLRHQVF